MSTLNTASTTASSRDVIEVDLIGLVAGVSVVAVILLVVLVVALVVLVRNKLRNKHDRSGVYIVPEGTPSPYDSVHRNTDLPNNGAVAGNPANVNGYDNKAMSNGELRQNPLAEPGIYPTGPTVIKPGISLSNMPPQYDSYPSNRLTASSVSLHYSNDNHRELKSFYSKLYEKLGDTIHEHNGRPLYLCKRDDYRKLSNYFDIIGKSRMGDWLIRPRAGVPNRPKSKKRSNKKTPAPRPDPQPVLVNSYEGRVNGGFLLGMPSSSGVIATPFGAASRMPASYLTKNSLENAENLAYTEQQKYTSLPKDIRRQAGGSRDSREGVQISRRESGGPGDRNKQLDERVYAELMRKHSRNGTADGSPVIIDRKNPNRRERFRNITEESSQAHSPPVKAQSKSNRQDNGGGDGGAGGAGGRGGIKSGGGGGVVVGHRERSGSNSTVKSLGITDQFKFLDQYETEEERF